MQSGKSKQFSTLYLFLTVLGLCGCAWAFSSCGEQGLLFVVVRGHLLLQGMGSRVLGSVVKYTGLVAPSCVGSSQTRDQTHIPCIGRWILNHWTTREVQQFFFCIQNPTSASVTNYSPFCLSPQNCAPQVALQTCPNYQALPLITETLSPSAVHSSSTRRANRIQLTCQLQQWQPELLGLKKKKNNCETQRERVLWSISYVCYGPRKERGIMHAVYLPARS